MNRQFIPTYWGHRSVKRPSTLRHSKSVMVGSASEINEAEEKKSKRSRPIAVRKHAKQLRELKCHLGSHSVTRQSSHSRLYHSQLRLVLNLAISKGCRDELTYCSCLVTYRGDVPARIRSPISVLTGLNVE